MNVFPLDPAVFDQGIVGLIGVEPVLDFETQDHKRDRDGVPKWRLQLLYRAPRARKPEVVEVGFSASEELALEPGARPVFTNLIGRHWENENTYGFSSGVAISADQVGLRTAPSAQRPPNPKAA